MQSIKRGVLLLLALALSFSLLLHAGAENAGQDIETIEDEVKQPILEVNKEVKSEVSNQIEKQEVDLRQTDSHVNEAYVITGLTDVPLVCEENIDLENMVFENYTSKLRFPVTPDHFEWQDDHKPDYITKEIRNNNLLYGWADGEADGLWIYLDFEYESTGAYLTITFALESFVEYETPYLFDFSAALRLEPHSRRGPEIQIKGYGIKHYEISGVNDVQFSAYREEDDLEDIQMNPQQFLYLFLDKDAFEWDYIKEIDHKLLADNQVEISYTIVSGEDVVQQIRLDHRTSNNDSVYEVKFKNYSDYDAHNFEFLVYIKYKGQVVEGTKTPVKGVLKRPEEIYTIDDDIDPQKYNPELVGYTSSTGLKLDPGTQLKILLTKDHFDWTNEVPDILTVQMLENNGISIKKKINQSGDVIADVKWENADNGVHIIITHVRMKSSKNFDYEIYLGKARWGRTDTAFRISGTLKGTGSGNTGGNSGKGSGGGGGGNSRFAADRYSAGTISTSTSTQTFTPIDSATAISETKSQIAAGKSSVTLKNASTITPDTAKAIADAAGKSVKINADSMKAGGNAVDVRLSVDPAGIAKTVDLSASTESSHAGSVKTKFEKAFVGNKIGVVSLSHKGEFGTPVSVAVKADTVLKSESLTIYAYDSASNKYKIVENPGAWWDTNGYLHFSVTQGGDYIITDKPLTK